MESWSATVKEHITVMPEIKEEVDAIVSDFITSGTHTGFIDKMKEPTQKLQRIRGQYDEMLLVLSRYFDEAEKVGTLTKEHYDKSEEFIETIRSELKDIFKKVYSFSTLEMDFYEKLLSVDRDSLKEDIEAYRTALTNIHRHDQYLIVQMNIADYMTSTISLMKKFSSFLSNNDNVSELRRVETHNQGFRPY